MLVLLLLLLLHQLQQAQQQRQQCCNFKFFFYILLFCLKLWCQYYSVGIELENFYPSLLQFFASKVVKRVATCFILPSLSLSLPSLLLSLSPFPFTLSLPFSFSLSLSPQPKLSRGGGGGGWNVERGNACWIICVRSVLNCFRWWLWRTLFGHTCE